MKQNNKLLLATVVVGVFGVISFYAGIQYQTRFGSRVMQGQFQGNRSRIANGNSTRFGGSPVIGEVIAIDNTSMTVKLPDESSKIVLLSDKVEVSTSEIGSMSAVIVGAKVGVFGTSNADGTVVAQTIQLNPQFRLGKNE